METKKYGLIQLSKNSNKPIATLKKNIFESDSDDNEDGNEDSSRPNVKKRVDTSSGVKRQTQLDISRALTEDPNVFEYDSIYDDMKTKKEETKVAIETDLKNKERPKPKYMNTLLKYSENRKLETERRAERKIQKERELEGNEFADKEQFVTNAYKQKLQEMKALELKEQKEQQIEDMLDVRKQQDLSGFYRNLLNRDMSSEPKTSETDLSSEELAANVAKETKVKDIPKSKPNRQFRARRKSSSEEEEDGEVVDESKEKPNLFKKPNFEDKSNNQSNKTINKRQESKSGTNELLHDKHKTAITTSSDDQKSSDNLVDNNETTNDETTAETEEERKPKLSRRELLIQMFTKRTVGEVLTEAQMRYFQRKGNYVL
ncbi:nuclear speckle splicing regulatory protein 1-like [Oppia nitens]|uniref:nuclear speckle splicing regulatory protein 1-like n=1 Tax=Oppia nitens TaxID=1686743 RepID=UPI0023DA38A9|nr:nuclear speckle splicing regulatory protein 1-like [Oppia nitens]XP_054166348.1 nuclear speckle splicing regulatory protein 1-like [Oppia nitens]